MWISFLIIAYFEILNKKKTEAKPRSTGGGGEIRTHGRISPTTVFRTVSLNHSDTPPNSISFYFYAEEVGLEPTNRFLHGYSLANWWLAIRRTPPIACILPQKDRKVNLILR